MGLSRSSGFKTHAGSNDADLIVFFRKSWGGAKRVTKIVSYKTPKSGRSRKEAQKAQIILGACFYFG